MLQASIFCRESIKTNNMNEFALKVLTDVDCYIYIDCEYTATVKKNQMERISLQAGEYYIQCINIYNPNQKIEQVIYVDKPKILKLEFNILSNKSLHIKNTTIGQLPCIYDEAGDFREGLAMVKKGDYWGFIDKRGEEVIPLIFDWVTDFYDGIALGVLNHQSVLIDKYSRETIPAHYNYIHLFHEGKASARKYISAYKYKYGFIDKNANEILPFIYDEASSFSEGYAGVSLNGSSGFIDDEGNEMIALNFGRIHDFHEGLAAVSQNDKWGCVNKRGDEVIPQVYETVDDFYEGLARIENDDFKFGFINKKGEIVVPYKYDNEFTQRYIDDSGRKCEYHYTNIGTEYHEGLASVGIKQKWGYINEEGNEIIPLIYNFTYRFSEGLAIVLNQSDKYGVIDRNGNLIIEFSDKFIGAFHDGYAIVSYHGKKGVIDKNGNEIIPLIYDDADDFHEGFARVKQNGKWGYIFLNK